MILKTEFNAEALTPELGGEFGDIKLKIKYKNDFEKKGMYAEMLSKGGKERTHWEMKHIKDLITGWENLLDKDGNELKFSEKNKKWLEDYGLSKTGKEREYANEKDKPEEKEYLNLNDYILKFSFEKENYVKN